MQEGAAGTPPGSGSRWLLYRATYSTDTAGRVLTGGGLVIDLGQSPQVHQDTERSHKGRETGKGCDHRRYRSALVYGVHLLRERLPTNRKRAAVAARELWAVNNFTFGKT